VPRNNWPGLFAPGVNHESEGSEDPARGDPGEGPLHPLGRVEERLLLGGCVLPPLSPPVGDFVKRILTDTESCYPSTQSLPILCTVDCV
jgi:hypothetical protein